MMTLADWTVSIAGLAAIVAVNWYFFFAEGQASAAVLAAGGTQEITIQVKGGYSPSIIRVKSDTPVRLVFDRQETATCSDELVFGDFGIRRFLPPFEKTVVELTPTEPGSYEFTCGMGMMRGRMVVEQPGDTEQ
jgi:plastocyanin domain-containing protein